jgi:hypothetical protein
MVSSAEVVRAGTAHGHLEIDVLAQRGFDARRERVALGEDEQTRARSSHDAATPAVLTNRWTSSTAIAMARPPATIAFRPSRWPRAMRHADRTDDRPR